MVFNLTETDRIVSNANGGFDWQTAVTDKAGVIRANPKTGAEQWAFREFHPKMERLLESYVMQAAPVMDDALRGAYEICATIRTEHAKMYAMYGDIGKELDAVTQERDRLKEQLKAREKKADTAATK